jgi:hypothetical protein
MIACVDATLDLADPPADDDVVPAEGEGEIEQPLCEAHPELPSPVKVLLLVDVSGSLQFTDQANTRFAAIQNLITSLAAQNALVATMGFGSNVYTEPVVTNAADPMFIPASQWVEPSFLHIRDVLTDLEGALDAARMHIEADIRQSDRDTLARTRYVVILFTDGVPDPVCCVEGAEHEGTYVDPLECPAEPWEEPASAGARTCDTSDELALCDDPAATQGFRDDVTGAVFPDGAPVSPDYGDGVLPPLHGLAPGGNYNRIGNIQDAARLLGSLELDGAGAVELHALMLADPTLPDSVKALYHLNACRMQRTMERVAQDANGAATLFSSGSSLDFTIVDTSPLCPTSDQP